MAALVYALEWDYLRGLGDWAGMRASWLRLNPAKTEITQEVQKAGGGGEDRKDKPISALPPNSTPFYTQTKFEAQRSCYRQSWYYARATSKSLFSLSALGKERVTSYFRCGFLTFTIFWSPQEQATVMALLAQVLKITQKLKWNQTWQPKCGSIITYAWQQVEFNAVIRV